MREVGNVVTTRARDGRVQAVVWKGLNEVVVESTPDPVLEHPTDAIVRVTAAGLCGSDLHLLDALSMFMHPGDILGHEVAGIVESTGPEVEQIAVGDRVIVPFNISCGHCFMCDRQLFAQCETTQVRRFDRGAALFGYSELYGQVPGGQAQYVRVPQAHFGPVKVAGTVPDERYVLMADVLPTAWQAVAQAGLAEGNTVAIFGLGPIGQMCVRISRHLGAETIIGVDRVDARLEMASRLGAQVIDERMIERPAEAVKDLTERGADIVVDAVGMEAHANPLVALAQKVAARTPKALAAPVARKAGVDRLAVLRQCFEACRRGGTVSIIGVYGGNLDVLPLGEIFDKGLTLKMGQAHVRQWTEQILPLVEDPADPLALSDFVTHVLPLSEAAEAYRTFADRADSMIKTVFTPAAA